MFPGPVCAANSQLYRGQGVPPTPRAAAPLHPVPQHGRPYSEVQLRNGTTNQHTNF